MQCNAQACPRLSLARKKDDGELAKRVREAEEVCGSGRLCLPWGAVRGVGAGVRPGEYLPGQNVAPLSRSIIGQHEGSFSPCCFPKRRPERRQIGLETCPCVGLRLRLPLWPRLGWQSGRRQRSELQSRMRMRLLSGACLHLGLRLGFLLWLWLRLRLTLRLRLRLTLRLRSLPCQPAAMGRDPAAPLVAACPRHAPPALGLKPDNEPRHRHNDPQTPQPPREGAHVVALGTHSVQRDVVAAQVWHEPPGIVEAEAGGELDPVCSAGYSHRAHAITSPTLPYPSLPCPGLLCPVCPVLSWPVSGFPALFCPVGC